MADNLPGNATAIAERIRRDFRLRAIQTGTAAPDIYPGSDFDLIATAVANSEMIGVANTARARDDIDTSTASPDALEEKRVALGLPEVQPTGSSGKVVPSILGATTIANGEQLTLPNGLRLEIVGTYINPLDGEEMDVQAIDTGVATNALAGVTVTFVAPPVNVESAALVSVGSPLTGGTDEESTERKRARIENAIANRPAGGNWAHVREIATNANGSIQDCVVYPALGGPASKRSVPLRAFDRVALDWSRSPSAEALASVRAAIQAQLPIEADGYVQAAVDEPVDVALEVSIPAAKISGGNGQGWTDAVPWPALEVADSGRVTVTSTSGNTVTVGANTATAPVDYQTTIAWWSAVDCRFHLGSVTGSSGGATAWVLTLDAPLVDSTGSPPQAGDFICPAANNIQAYGVTWLDILDKLGPGENTTDVSRLPRAARHPFPGDELPSDIAANIFVDFTRSHPEMTSVTTGYASATTPTVPGVTTTPPSIFTPRHFGIYEA